MAAVGTTEQHGPHLVTGTDALLAETLALRAAEAAASPDVILLAPITAERVADALAGAPVRTEAVAG